MRTRILLAATLLLAALGGVYALHRSRTFQLFGGIESRVERITGPAVALTFDDGPTAGADSLLDYLRANRVPATFFLTGSGIAENPAVARRLVADGHELGNHTYSHRPMVLRSPSFIRREVERTDSLVRRAGHAGPIFFRPPYGKKLVGLPLYLRNTGRLTITWDVEPESDPDVARDADRIVEHVLARARPGSIILLHPWYRANEPTRRAVPRIVEGLRARGFELLTVRDLRERAGE